MEMDSGAAGSEAKDGRGVTLSHEGVQAMRQGLHELANIFTGVKIACDLLSLELTAGPLRHYAANISAGSERGCVLVREMRSRLLAACAEAKAGPGSNQGG